LYDPPGIRIENYIKKEILKPPPPELRKEDKIPQLFSPLLPKGYEDPYQIPHLTTEEIAALKVKKKKGAKKKKKRKKKKAAVKKEKKIRVVPEWVK